MILENVLMYNNVHIYDKCTNEKCTYDKCIYEKCTMKYIHVKNALFLESIYEKCTFLERIYEKCTFFRTYL